MKRTAPEWTKSPDAMLRARAALEAARETAPSDGVRESIRHAREVRESIRASRDDVDHLRALARTLYTTADDLRADHAVEPLARNEVAHMLDRAANEVARAASRLAPLIRGDYAEGLPRTPAFVVPSETEGRNRP